MGKVDRKYNGYVRKEHCEICGKKDDKSKDVRDEQGFLLRKGRVRDRNYLTIHHIDHNPMNSNHNNLQTLCRDCHNEIHRVGDIMAVIKK